VSEAYDAFIKSVARNRGVKPAQARNDFGEGRVVGARQAVELGMADRMGTLEETISRLLKAAPVLTEQEQRQADELRQRVQSILHKEINNVQ
jgi:ClpP class serine protease